MTRIKLYIFILLLWSSCNTGESNVAENRKSKETLTSSVNKNKTDSINKIDSTQVKKEFNTYTDKVRTEILATEFGQEDKIWIHEHAIGFLLKDTDSQGQNIAAKSGLFPINNFYSKGFPVLIACNWTTYYSEKANTQSAYLKLKKHNIKFIGYRYDIPGKKHGFLSNTIYVRTTKNLSPSEIDAFKSKLKKSFPVGFDDFPVANTININLNSTDLDLMIKLYKKAKKETIVESISFGAFSCLPQPRMSE